MPHFGSRSSNTDAWLQYTTAVYSMTQKRSMAGFFRRVAGLALEMALTRWSAPHWWMPCDQDQWARLSSRPAC